MRWHNPEKDAIEHENTTGLVDVYPQTLQLAAWFARRDLMKLKGYR